MLVTLLVTLSAIVLVGSDATQSDTDLFPAFNFSAQSGGWQVNAAALEVSLTWLATGMTWRSLLVEASFANRRSWENNGCWQHQVDKPRRSSPLSIASLQSGKVLEHGRIVLTGEIMSPSYDGKSSVPGNWTLTMLPEQSGTMVFNISIELSQSKPNTSFPGSGGRGSEEWYRYVSTDVTLLWQLAGTDEEQLVGAGEQYSMIGLRGESFDIWSGEQGIGRGKQPITRSMDIVAWPCAGNSHTTYSAVPALLSTRGYGLALDNTQLVHVDLTSPATAKMTVAFEAHHWSHGAPKLRISGRIWGGPDVRSLLRGLTDITGRMSAPPSWMQDGLIVGDEGGLDVVQQHVDTLLAAKVPVAGVWIQDWSGKLVSKNGEFVWWNWVLDEQRYPKSWFRNMSAQGIKVLTYINPFLTSASQSDGRQPEVFLEAQRLGYLVQDNKGRPIIKKVSFADFEFGMVDVFNPDAAKWWTGIIRCNVMMACEDGTPLVHAWMHDYGEYFPLLGAARKGSPQGRGTDLHNQFPIYSAQTARAASEGYPNVTFFARSGSLRSPSVANMFWVGDQLTSYDACDGLQSALIGTMSGGLSGWTVNHADIGAFTMIDRVPWLPLDIHFKRDSELNVRWMELTVFINAIYRSHPGLLPNISSQLWDSNVLSYTKRMTELFRDLRPYRDFLFSEAASQGLPLVRHGILVEPKDSTWFNPSLDFADDRCTHGNEIGLFQFYFGDDIIVAPALREGVEEVHAYIPSGTWIHFWLNQIVEGPSYSTWESPLGKPVFFYRASSSWSNFFRQLARRYADPPSKLWTSFV